MSIRIEVLEDGTIEVMDCSFAEKGKFQPRFYRHSTIESAWKTAENLLRRDLRRILNEHGSQEV